MCISFAVSPDGHLLQSYCKFTAKLQKIHHKTKKQPKIPQE